MTKPQPIRDMLMRYAESGTARFHMPGHKGHSVIFGAWDITELEESDNLQYPRGVIARSQDRWASAAGARVCRYLVNGATLGVQAMVLGCLPREGKLIAARDAHRALSSALAAFTVQPVWAESEWDAERLLYRCNVPALLRKLEETPDADGVFITTPDYYGRIADTTALAAACASRGIPLLADCAHGGLAQFLPRLPRLKADVWVVSAHKTLSALTQTALMFSGEERPKLDAALRALQTSSPSYLMMASLEQALDIARNADYGAYIIRMEAMRHSISEMKGLFCAAEESALQSGYAACDPGRLCVDVTGRGLSGYRAAEILRETGVRAEMADMRRVVFICTPWDEAAWDDRLTKALSALPEEDFTVPRIARPPEGLPSLQPWEVFSRKWEVLPLAEAEGRVLAEPLTVYPPGTALCVPGERMTREVAAYCRMAIALGGEAAGNGETISVIEE
ncbi:MAG: aminotransferase class I/II-fold pyridoxal phosphate-dependent enzyme [Christensenellales bacterium]